MDINYFGKIITFVNCVILLLVIGVMGGVSGEEKLHRDVCPCKKCSKWRRVRDANKEVEG